MVGKQKRRPARRLKLSQANISGFTYEGKALANGGMSRDFRWDTDTKERCRHENHHGIPPNKRRQAVQRLGSTSQSRTINQQRNDKSTALESIRSMPPHHLDCISSSTRSRSAFCRNGFARVPLAPSARAPASAPGPLGRAPPEMAMILVLGYLR